MEENFSADLGKGIQSFNLRGLWGLGGAFLFFFLIYFLNVLSLFSI